jgi:hypothetical protein
MKENFPFIGWIRVKKDENELTFKLSGKKL